MAVGFDADTDWGSRATSIGSVGHTGITIAGWFYRSSTGANYSSVANGALMGVGHSGNGRSAHMKFDTNFGSGTINDPRLCIGDSQAGTAAFSSSPPFDTWFFAYLRLGDNAGTRWMWGEWTIDGSSWQSADRANGVEGSVQAEQVLLGRAGVGDANTMYGRYAYFEAFGSDIGQSAARALLNKGTAVSGEFGFWALANNTTPSADTSGNSRNMTLNGTATSETSPTLSGGGSGPTVTSHPSGQTVVEGSTATFTVSATGAGTLTYQWQVNDGAGWDDIVGATSSSYITPATTLTLRGYQYRCEVTDDDGSINSNAATLTVNIAPRVDAALVGTGHTETNTVSTSPGLVEDGDSLVAFVAYDPSATITGTVQDSAGNVYTLAANQTGGTGRLAAYYCEDAVGASNVVLTVNFSATAYPTLSLHRVFGEGGPKLYDAGSLISTTDATSPYTATTGVLQVCDSVVLAAAELNSGSDGAYVSSNYDLLSSEPGVATYWTHGAFKLPVRNNAASTPSITRTNSANTASGVIALAFKAAVPTAGGHGLEYDFLGDGGGTITTPAFNTQPSGSSIIAVVARGSISDFTGNLPTDNKGNGSYTQLGTAHAYTDWPTSGTALYVKTGAIGGSAHTVSVAKPSPTDEVTLAAVELTGVGQVIDYDWAEDLTEPNASPTVTTTGPAVLVALWFGDDTAGELNVAVSYPWTRLEATASLASNHIQMGMAYRTVTEAGDYGVEWDPATSQGAQLWIVALEPGSGDLSGSVGRSDETDSAFANAKRKAKALGRADTANTAFVAAPRKARTAGRSDEADTAFALTFRKAKALGRADEAGVALARTPGKTKVLGRADGANTALAGTARKSRLATQISEVDTSAAFTHRWARAAGISIEAGTALALVTKKAKANGVSIEADSALALSADISEAGTVGLAVEADSGFGLIGLKERTTGLAVTGEVALNLTANKRGSTGLGSESEEALALARRKSVGAAISVETDTALAVTHSGSKPATAAIEVNTSFALTHRKVRQIGIAVETDAALAPSVSNSEQVGRADETDSALALLGRHTRVVSLSTGVDVSLSLVGRKTRSVGLIAGVNEGLSVTGRKQRGISFALETNIAFALTANDPPADTQGPTITLTAYGS